MFLIEQILAGICELFTGPDKLAYSAIQFASSIHTSSMMHNIPDVQCMLNILIYFYCSEVCFLQMCTDLWYYSKAFAEKALSLDDIRSENELVYRSGENIKQSLFFHGWSGENDELRFVTVDLFPVFVCHPWLTVTVWRRPSCHSAQIAHKECCGVLCCVTQSMTWTKRAQMNCWKSTVVSQCIPLVAGIYMWS